MSTKKENVAVAGVGAAACIACCAGPILGFAAAVGLGTVGAIFAFGAIGMLVAVVATAIIIRRRRRAVPCSTSATTQVELTRQSR